MYYEHKTDDLFSIQLHSADEESKPRSKEYDNIIKYPKESGCTGAAIKLSKPIHFTKGQLKPGNFAEDIDNIVGAQAVESMIVYPIIFEGKLHGVIQLVNKLYGEPVTESDVRELGALIPTLGRIIMTIGDVREIENISSAIQMGMYQLKDSISSKLESVGQDELLDLQSAVM